MIKLLIYCICNWIWQKNMKKITWMQCRHHILTTSVLTRSTTFSRSPIIYPSLFSLCFLISLTSLPSFSYIFSSLSRRIYSSVLLCSYSSQISLDNSSSWPAYWWYIFLRISLVTTVDYMWVLWVYSISVSFCLSMPILARQLWFILLLKPASSIR